MGNQLTVFTERIDDVVLLLHVMVLHVMDAN